MHADEIEKLEIDLFLESLYRRYGYDFRHYARASVKRRLRHILSKFGYPNLSAIIPDLVHNEDFAFKVIYEFSIPVTEMFRDPGFYRSLREKVIPYLRTYPFIRIWVAGCATGEEVYSIAILMQEEKLYDSATIFATDFNELALKKAQEGIYPLKDIQQYTINYQRSGGEMSFGDYYHAEYGSVIMHPSLRENITFANHNLVTDGVFSEVHLVLCRNVLIYFDRSLQNRALGVLADSLSRAGFFCLGTKETLDYSDARERFRVVDMAFKIYQKQVS